MKQIPEPDENNAWRLESPGDLGSQRSPRPDAEDKYFMVSTDGHVQEPADLWLKRMDEKYRERLPGVAIDKQGDKFQKTEGFRPLRIRNIKFEGEESTSTEPKGSYHRRKSTSERSVGASVPVMGLILVAPINS